MLKKIETFKYSLILVLLANLIIGCNSTKTVKPSKPSSVPSPKVADNSVDKQKQCLDGIEKPLNEFKNFVVEPNRDFAVAYKHLTEINQVYQSNCKSLATNSEPITKIGTIINDTNLLLKKFQEPLIKQNICEGQKTLNIITEITEDNCGNFGRRTRNALADNLQIKSSELGNLVSNAKSSLVVPIVSNKQPTPIATQPDLRLEATNKKVNNLYQEVVKLNKKNSQLSLLLIIGAISLLPMGLILFLFNKSLRELNQKVKELQVTFSQTTDLTSKNHKTVNSSKNDISALVNEYFGDLYQKNQLENGQPNQTDIYPEDTLESNYSLLEKSLELEPVNQDFIENKNNYLYSELVKVYNTNPTALARDALRVSESTESMKQRLNTQIPIVLEKTTNYTCWVILGEELTYWLVPRGNLKINHDIYETIIALFDCHGYHHNYSKFNLVKPAKVYPISSNKDKWQLQEKGILEFI